MIRQERLEICGNCLHRKLDFEQGYLCNLTQKEGDFKDKCPHFTRDGTVTDSIKLRVRQRVEKQPLVQEPVVVNALESRKPEKKKKLSKDALKKIRKYQSFFYALVGGLIVMSASAMVWAFTAGMTGYQEYYLPLGVALLVGITVRFFGAGIYRVFGFLGGLLTISGCLLGNYLTRADILDQLLSPGYKEALTNLNPAIILETIMDSYVPTDLLIYGLAAIVGYLLSIRRIRSRKLVKLTNGEYTGAPVLYKLRLPLIIVGILVPAYFGFTQTQESNGLNEYYFDSGQKMSEGEMMHNRETGEWTYWYENGNLKCTGFFNNGVRDSLWRWYDLSGRITRSGVFCEGLEHGTWMLFYGDGSVSDSGAFVDGYREGLWKYWYDNGTIRMMGEMSRDKRIGLWKHYYNNGQIAEKIFHQDMDTMLVENEWDRDGVQLVSGGNGDCKRFSNSGALLASGEIRNGMQTGSWIFYYENGNTREEGVYIDGRYLIRNSWSPDGTIEIEEGNGIYHHYHNGTKVVTESGEIRNGTRTGLWKSYSRESGNLLQEVDYVMGQQTGSKKLYYESGQLRAMGNVTDGLKEEKWNWYHENGQLSVTVSFRADMKHGKLIRRNTRGMIVKEEYYQEGVLL